jgi:hypothetical protein
MDDDIWDQASDEDDDHQVTKISNKMASNILTKEEKYIIKRYIIY